MKKTTLTINLATTPSEGIMVIDCKDSHPQEFVKYSGITLPVFKGDKLVKPGVMHNVEKLQNGEYVKLGDITIR